VEIGKRHIGVVLRHELRRGFEMREVLGRPPIRELAARIELAALIVEAVLIS
jgi:hypothetical protein